MAEFRSKILTKHLVDLKKKTKHLEDDMNASTPSKATIIKAFQYINDEIGSLDAKLNESLVDVDINLNKVIVNFLR